MNFMVKFSAPNDDFEWKHHTPSLKSIVLALALILALKRDNFENFLNFFLLFFQNVQYFVFISYEYRRFIRNHRHMTIYSVSFSEISIDFSRLSLFSSLYSVNISCAIVKLSCDGIIHQQV